MGSNDLQSTRNASRNCNESVLVGAGFIKQGNSCLYIKGSKFHVLSPGIGEGKHGKYWFDIRMANLEKINKVTDAKSWILLRIVPNWFAFFTIQSIQEHLSRIMQEERMHSGKVWGFYCNLDEKNRKVDVFAKNSKSTSFSTDLLDRDSAVAFLRQI